MPAELTEDSSNTPNLVIIGISLAAFGFLLVNAALVAWFFVHQRRKKGYYYLLLFYYYYYYYSCFLFSVLVKYFLVYKLLLMLDKFMVFDQVY